MNEITYMVEFATLRIRNVALNQAEDFQCLRLAVIAKAGVSSVSATSTTISRPIMDDLFELLEDGGHEDQL
ncbi:MAG: hypothetical protein HIU84_10730 [Acidobacteria bacterium]|nr:hypothetical protein [Acidobacteriota bacterium]